MPPNGDIVVLPPVAQGDVYRVAQERPSAIGIVDGYFEGVLSVWHKEILWAMAEGIHVFGSASMGALRAAELHPFGMYGTGRIFEAYRDGELEDDDEVAVIHGPAETGYLALSEAMVNIRETLAAAGRKGVITDTTSDALVRVAKELFYHDRTFERLLERAADHSMPPQELAALRAWLPQGRVDQKREDALAMLAAMQMLLAQRPGAACASTMRSSGRAVWDDASHRCGGSPMLGGSAVEWRAVDAILEELRLEADNYAAVRDRALLRHLAAREADRRRQPVDAAHGRDLATRLRAQHGLFTRADLDLWLEANAIDSKRLERTRRRRDAVRGDQHPRRVALHDELLDELRLRNDFARFADRAQDKQSSLESARAEPTGSDDARLAPPALCGPGISSVASASRCRTTSMRPRASLASTTGPISIARCAANGYTQTGRKAFERG